MTADKIAFAYKYYHFHFNILTGHVSEDGHTEYLMFTENVGTNKISELMVTENF